jgi:hypothetical protein
MQTIQFIASIEKEGNGREERRRRKRKERELTRMDSPLPS